MNHPKAVKKIYELISQELSENRYNAIAMTRAIAEAKGNNDLARSLYIQFRAEELHSELESFLLEQSIRNDSPSVVDQPVDRPLQKFSCEQEGRFFLSPRVYTMIVRERSISIINEDEKSIDIDAASDCYGVQLHKGKRGFNTVTIFSGSGTFSLDLQIDDGEYQCLSEWKRRNNLQ